jgi:hypothetical protein
MDSSLIKNVNRWKPVLGYVSAVVKMEVAPVLKETRSFRPFKSSEEYLYAMKEDLAEWLNMLYPDVDINVYNCMDRLDTGVALCKVL